MLLRGFTNSGSLRLHQESRCNSCKTTLEFSLSFMKIPYLMAADIQLRSFTDKAIWQAVRWLISGVGPKMLGTAARYNADTKKKSVDFFGKIIGRWADRVYRCLCRRCRRRGHGRRQRLSSCYVIVKKRGSRDINARGLPFSNVVGLTLTSLDYYRGVAPLSLKHRLHRHRRSQYAWYCCFRLMGYRTVPVYNVG